MNREEFIKRHAEHCFYKGAGPKTWLRMKGPHKGRGAKKYLSERGRIKQCGKSLFNWCIKHGIETVGIATWQDLPVNKQPRNATGRCVVGEHR